MQAPERGDFVWIDLDPQAGHEQAGRRPALVLSTADFNRRTGFAFVCPVTRQVKGYAFEVPLPAGAAITGVALADQVKSLDWRARNVAVAGKADAAAVDAVLRIVRTIVA